MAQKMIPHSSEAEKAVLGAVMIDPESFTDIQGGLKGEDFHSQKHRWVFEAFTKLQQAGRPLDLMNISNALEQSKRLEPVGGTAFLSHLLTVVPSALNVKSYADIVREKSQRRQLLNAAQVIARGAYDEETPIGDVLSTSESAIFDVRSGQPQDRLIHIAKASADTFNALEDAQNSDGTAELPTGYAELDKILSWRPGELSIIAARPGIGKTALLSTFVTKLIQRDHACLVFSAEMSHTQWVKRMIQSAGVENLPKRGNTGDWAGVERELDKFSGYPMWIDDTPNIRVDMLVARAKRLAARQPLRFIAVDYVQLLKTDGRHKERYLEISDITKALKQLSRELNCHVCAAAQLSRMAEDSRPTLAALKESGSQEEDADVVIAPYREREIPKDASGRPIAVVDAELIVLKQRNGATGSVDMYWHPTRVCYVPKARGVKA